jgi:hypothetical protein
MARESKAAREARVVAEHEARLLEQANAYPARLMALLERATRENFELTVKDSLFRLENRDDRYDGVYLLTLEFTQTADTVLDTLEWAVRKKEEARAEAEHKANLRATALNKLSEEERTALGL